LLVFLKIYKPESALLPETPFHEIGGIFAEGPEFLLLRCPAPLAALWANIGIFAENRVSRNPRQKCRECDFTLWNASLTR